MKYEQRRKELIQGLEATGNEIVYQHINHVAEVLGIEKAEELHNSGTLVKTTEAVRMKRNGAGTQTISKVLQGGIAEFNRESLLEALKASPETQPSQENGKDMKKLQDEASKSEIPGELNQSKASHQLVQGNDRGAKVDSGPKTPGTNIVS